MIFRRPVAAMARAIAIRFASVPELVKRTSSTERKRSHTRRASSASIAVWPARLRPRSSAPTIAARIAGCECP